MRLQTQTRLLIISIVAVPLVAILCMTIYRNFISDNFIYSIITDYDIPTLIREHIDQEDYDAILSTVHRFRRFSVIGVIFGSILTIFGICMSLIITRTITHSVKVLENATKRIADGELDLKVEVKGNNEIISLTNSLNKMRNALKEEELRRSRFVMGISHDLKTPLALIKGYAEAIEDGVADINAAEIIGSKADQLESMINDLIDFVKMDTGEWREQLKKVNITAFLHNMIKSVGMDVELLNQELTSSIVLPEQVFISMDEKLVYRAFENLIHNAVRYSPAQSVIRLTAIPAENGLEIIVNDNGFGIEKSDLPHVFEMFYRGSSSRREQGMGLGLAVVKWVIDYHGWAISVTSEKEEGTSFTISIPIDYTNRKSASSA